jgi:DnaJ like chaperone protein
MSWWGKLAGGAFGFMLGGPLGAALGAALGHQFDKGLGRIGGGIGGEFLRVGSQERVQTAFFTATFSVLGHLAKADGHVSPREIAMARNIMAQMQLNELQRKAAVKLFNAGKQPGFPLDEALDQFRVECHHRTTLLQMFLEIQVQGAMADGRVDAVEHAVLSRISDRLGFAPHHVEEILRFVRGAGNVNRQAAPNLNDAYQVLGVKRSSSDAEIKKAYRRLMSQHHPDKLVAKGLPDEMLKLATEKTQQIQKAYDQVKENRA